MIKEILSLERTAMKRYQMLAMVVVCALPLVSALVFLGCEVGSSDSATRNVSVDFTGFYDSTETNSDFVSPANSGSRVTSLNVRQSGDQLQAVDNNGIIFEGTLSDSALSSGTATANFRLDGRTTAGQSVTISGSLSGTGESGTMRGTWIEPSLLAYVHGDAVINTVPTNQPPPVTNAVTLTASSTTLTTEGSKATLTALGGSGSYEWTIESQDRGTWVEEPGTGNQAVYQRVTAGANTITVADSANGDNHDSVTIQQP
jgi:hypothetical protein